jgi:hypothetical protein
LALFPFTLACAIEEMMAHRGVDVSYETSARGRWFGKDRRQPSPSKVAAIAAGISMNHIDDWR